MRICVPGFALPVVAAALVVAACDGDSKDSASTAPGEQPSATAAVSPTTAPTLRPTAAATVAPTATPLPFDAAKLPPALMPADQVSRLLGAGFRTLQDKATDAELPFSSVPTMGATLAAQEVSLLYNSFQVGAAPAAGRPFAAQNTVQGYPTTANSIAAFAALRTTWQGTLFQNVQQQIAPVGWDESFCQIGDYTTPTGGQRQQWLVCMARAGLYVVTVSAGGIAGLDASSVGGAVRTYFDLARTSLP